MTLVTISNNVDYKLPGSIGIACSQCGLDEWALACPAHQPKCTSKLRLKCKSCKRKESSIWKASNAELNSAHNAAWYEKNKAKSNTYTKQWASHNRAKCNAYQGARRAAKLQRTPVWADLAEIALIYANCPVGMHVDHIVPLRGKLVSGLHVPSNLQYLTPEQNFKKSAKYIGG